jgi:hypothetical protein
MREAAFLTSGIGWLDEDVSLLVAKYDWRLRDARQRRDGVCVRLGWLVVNHDLVLFSIALAKDKTVIVFGGGDVAFDGVSLYVISYASFLRDPHTEY